ncbi:cysteine--tRNA ligase [Rhodomicrobium sp. Az07]|uniref:cysteine--tRNA ligase n=1 Tax=Rhodomicrobium sp. Az07 TaxID=2839034 RepID=UPI001BEB634E|nr:cysteine--tRNA ligase [Rhodomicrobium sp. Az07]MBT3071495.1 cysteine--tRNA ligase [Rhodomicrobium sp. Az07]
MNLKLYNTRTRRKEIFRPIDEKAVRMYVCGPTVYDFAHIGNARPVIVFDVLFRLLRHVYGADRVIYVRNITDVDDKINARAAAEGISIRELTERTTAQFHADVAAIGALPPTIEPRATEHISEMIALVERLVERDHAYAAEGHVLFNVPSDDDYGELSRRSVEDMRAGARVEVAPYKRDPMDFVLWKPSEGAEPGWESPWGYGRPGWHLECSAMAAKHLGTVFDIHGGGIDLLFPHHENEVAQSTCAHGTEIMANYWVHNGHLQVEGQKMSKSLGNFITIREALQQQSLFSKRPGDIIRLAMLMTNYRQPIDYTSDRLAEARAILKDIKYAIRGVDPNEAKVNQEILDALSDDLNTYEAKNILYRLAVQARSKDCDTAMDSARELVWSLNLLGFDELVVEETRQNTALDAAVDSARRIFIDERITARLAARKSKNWAEADRIRDELAAMGVALKDAKNPATGEIETTWEIAR